MGLLSTIQRRTRKGSNYPYATARVRAKKAKLLPRETYLKMLKMSIPEITQLVAETVYQEQVDELAARFSGVDLLESALNVNQEHTNAQVRHFTTGEAHDLVAAFLARYDFRDIKVILRGKHYGASQEEMMRELLIEDREEFEFLRRLMADDVDGIQGVVAQLGEMGGHGRVYYEALKGAEALRDEPRLPDYEDALDRAYYVNLLETLRPTSAATRLFRRFVEKEIDVVNLLAVLRYRKAKLGWDHVEHLLIPGGLDLDKATLRRIHEAATVEEVQNELHATKFGTDLDDALGRSLARVEVDARQHLIGFASGFSHMNPLSILPIIDFLLRKETEVRNVRAIARGKEAGLEEGTIQDMLII